MRFPFTTEQFIAIFVKYNHAIWPLQILLNLIALTVIVLLIKRVHSGSKIINVFLSLFWLWMGIVYHIIFFSTINKAAYFFGLIYIIEGFLFFYFGIIKGKPTYKFSSDFAGITGVLLILYSLVIYPIIGTIAGHTYPGQPTFGLPCPTTIFTFGVLLFSTVRVPLLMLVIPFLWSLIGFSAALNFSIYEDVGLLISGIAAVTIIISRNKLFIAKMDV